MKMAMHLSLTTRETQMPPGGHARFQSCCNVYALAVQVGAVRDRVAGIYADAKADAAVRWLIAIMDRDLLLYLDGAPHRTVYTVEYNEQRVATGLNKPAPVFLDRGVDKIVSQEA